MNPEKQSQPKATTPHHRARQSKTKHNQHHSTQHIMAKIVYIRILQCPFNELSDVVQANRNTLIGRCATNKYFQIIGSIHDIESYSPIDHTSSYDVQILLCHWGHLAIILVWVSRNLFHIGWNGNYELWEQNPIDTLPIADGIWDPHFGCLKDYPAPSHSL
jgi:hypothetical protein